jgi:hypothetical protein
MHNFDDWNLKLRILTVIRNNSIDKIIRNKMPINNTVFKLNSSFVALSYLVESSTRQLYKLHNELFCYFYNKISKWLLNIFVADKPYCSEI